MEITDQELLTEVYMMVSEYVVHGEWKSPTQFNHVFDRLMGILPRPTESQELYRVLRLTDGQLAEYQAGTLELRNRKYSSWTNCLDCARRMAQTKGNNCIIISHIFSGDHIVIDVRDFYETHDFDSHREFSKYVRPENEVIVFDSGEMIINRNNSYLFVNDLPTIFPKAGDRVFLHDDDDDGQEIVSVDEDQPYATRGIFGVHGHFDLYWVRNVAPHEWEIVSDEIYETVDDEYLTMGNDPLRDNEERNFAFNQLADEQRGDPEMAMLRVQQANIGGVLSYVVEHVGDLTHRMAQYPSRSEYYSGWELVKSKVNRCADMLGSAYGFEREVEQNFKNNADYKKIPLEDLKKRVAVALQDYANEHAKLKVYNTAQWLGREAAVALGHQDWKRALQCLIAMQAHLDTPEDWDAFAAPYNTNYQK